MSLNQHQRMVQRRLQKARGVDEGIRRIHQRIEELRSLAASMGVKISDMPGNPNRNLHGMEDTVVRFCDMEKGLREELDSLMAIRAETLSYIRQVPDSFGRMVLERRYLDYDTWESISASMGRSVRTIQRIHDRSLEDIRIG